jgi:hypothetical protein
MPLEIGMQVGQKGPHSVVDYGRGGHPPRSAMQEAAAPWATTDRIRPPGPTSIWGKTIRFGRLVLVTRSFVDPLTRDSQDFSPPSS